MERIFVPWAIIIYAIIRLTKKISRTLLLLFVLQIIFFSGIMENLNPSYGQSYQAEKIFPVVNQQWFFGNPSSVAVDNNENFYVLNQSSNSVYKYTSEGQFIKGWGKEGSGEGEFLRPTSIAVSPDGYVCVSDTFNNRIQVFSTDGDFIYSLGEEGPEQGNFYNPCQIAFDGDGNLFVADKGNNRVQKFSSKLTFLQSFGTRGENPDQFYWPHGIAIDSSNQVYVYAYVSNLRSTMIQVFTNDGTLINSWNVAGYYSSQDIYESSHFTGICIDENDDLYIPDTYWNRILKYSKNGNFITQWGEFGNEDGRFSFVIPSTDAAGNYYGAVTSDNKGYIIVSDTYNNRIQAFTQQGDFLMSWNSGGTDDDQFHYPFGLTLDKDNNIYIVDSGNDRVQKYSSDGVFLLSFGSTASHNVQNGEFSAPHGIAIDSSGYIYVADTYNHRIQVFSSQGSFIRTFGLRGSNNGQLDTPFGIAINSKDEVLVADSGNNRIQKFSNTGRFISIFGDSESLGLDDSLTYPIDLTIDSDDDVYVLDTYKNRVVKFSSEGNYLFSFGGSGDEPGQFNTPQGIAIDSKGNVAVSDTWNNRIQIFTSDGVFIESFGELGYNAGQLSNPDNLEFDSNDKLYVAENLNNRVQVFSKPESDSEAIIKKAILVAGGGGYDGNILWEATQMCTNYAYRVLTFQGYTKDMIHYLSSDTGLDLDGNGLYDDVDNDATQENLYQAITDWASDADDLLVYITDHGGDSVFRMNQAELLNAEDIDLWLDSIQEQNTEQVSFIYDACQSGSFLEKMKPPQGKERVVIASASKGEQAYFTSQGSLSFSYLFWGFVMNGMNLFDAFIFAKNSIEYTYQSQTPIFDDNGNGIGNENMEGELAKEITLGMGLISAGDIPDIGSVSSRQILYGESNAQLFAENIIDTDGIGKVWAVITPPDFSNNNPDEPVLSLPSIELIKDQDNSDKYQGTYSDFDGIGTYNIAVFAMDTCGGVSLPKNTSVIQMGDGNIDAPPQTPGSFNKYGQYQCNNFMECFRYCYRI